jgi:protein tyrosine kinase modulator
LNTQLDAATQAISRAQQDKTFAESSLNEQLAEWKATQDGHNPQTQQQQLAALETQLADLKSKYTNDHPDVIRVQNDIEALKKKIAEATSEGDSTNTAKSNQTPIEPAAIQLLRAQIHANDETIKEHAAEQTQIQQRIKLYQSRIEASPEVEQEYKQLTRDYQTALDFHNDLLKKRNQSAMATDLEKRQEGEQFQVLDPANLPDIPSFPKKLDFGLGGLAAGLALGCGLIAVLEMRDTSLRSERDVEVLLDVPVLATVPVFRPASRKKPSITSAA